MVNRYIRLFLIPMPFCTFLCFWNFVLHLSPPTCLSFWIFFYSGSSIQCPFVWEMYLIFSSRTERKFGNFVLIWFSTLFFIHIAFLGAFDSYLPFGIQFLAWDHLYIIYCLPWFLYVGLLLSPPSIFFFKCDMDGASK